jgi:hypothetical protein
VGSRSPLAGGPAIGRKDKKITVAQVRIGFAGLDELFGFLREQTGEMVKEQPGYASYLLRLWREGGDREKATWRASLESTRTGELMTFASLDDLFDHLRELTGVVHGWDEKM